MICRRWRRVAFIALVLSAACTRRPAVTAATAEGPAGAIRIDPMLLVSVAEVRRILAAVGDSIYPGLSAERVPVLLYRPGVQDVLVGFPKLPIGFSAVRAPQLGGETVLVRDDTTFMNIDDQNTTRSIDGVHAAVIADQHSRLRNRLRGALLERPRDAAERWLEGWNFVPSAYDELLLILHETFHVVQERRSPGKRANEAAVARYPVLDSVNNALIALEAHALRDALLNPSAEGRRENAARFVAVRAERRARIDSASAAWEDLNEFVEGTARYVEYRFLKTARHVRPSPELFLRTGFAGYGDGLDTVFARRLNDMVAIASGTDDRFGNPFGGAPARYRSYELGAAQALLLDDIAPRWKERIFDPGVHLSALIAEALPLSAAARAGAVAEAKRAYRYDSILAAKGDLERRGRLAIQARVDSIRAAGLATVTIAYERAGTRLGMTYTPFGVTAVSPGVALYDLVPITVRFENGSELVMKQVIPIIVDRNAKTLTFAATTTPVSIVQRSDGTIETEQFRLVTPTGMILTPIGREVRIDLR